MLPAVGERLDPNRARSHRPIRLVTGCPRMCRCRSCCHRLRASRSCRSIAGLVAVRAGDRSALGGLVADGDGLFSAAGEWLGRRSPNGIVLYIGAALLVLAVTTVLNLDTSVAFLTPILVYTAHSRGGGEDPLLYGCLLLSNAGSLLLPGSNLTNLIVLGHLHLSGGAFLRHMAPAALAAAFVTALVVGAWEHRALRTTAMPVSGDAHPVLGVGLVAVVAVTLLVLVLRSPAVPVAVVGLAAISIRSSSASISSRGALKMLGLPVLVGLFGMAVALGTLGRSWSGPATLLSHLDAWGTAGLGRAVQRARQQPPGRIAVGRQGAPSTLCAPGRVEHRTEPFVTGSLAWFLWLRAARSAGSDHPSPRPVALGSSPCRCRWLPH